MTGLLPSGIQQALERQPLYDLSETYGIVTLVLLVLLLVELEALRVRRTSPGRATVVTALVVPLVLAVMLTITLRVTALLP